MSSIEERIVGVMPALDNMDDCATYEEMAQKVRAAFRASGLRVVPEEPTEEMLSAGDSSIPRAEPDYQTGIRMMGREVALECWKAMLAAIDKEER